MLRRFLRFLAHFAAACLLLAGLLFAAECFLRSQESQHSQSIDPTENSRIFDRSSAVHHSLRPSAIINEPAADGQANRFTINSFGLRGTEPVVPKPASLYRILILGDETVFAASIHNEQTVAAQLQSHLQRTTNRSIEVVNGGVPGYCPLLSLLQFRHRLAGLRPDLVVLSFSLNDPDDDYRYRPGLITDRNGRALSCSHHTLAPDSEDNPLTELRQYAIGRWASRKLLEGTVGNDNNEGRRLRWLHMASGADWEKQLNATIRPIAELATITKQLSARFVLTTVPVSEQLFDASNPIEPVKARTFAARNALISLASKHQFEFCDLSGVLVNEDLTPDRPGLTESGHYNLAVELAAHITRSRASRPSTRYHVQQVSAEQNRF